MLQKATLANNRKRNEGTPLKVEWFDAAQVNLVHAEAHFAADTRIDLGIALHHSGHHDALDELFEDLGGGR